MLASAVYFTSFIRFRPRAKFFESNLFESQNVTWHYLHGVFRGPLPCSTVMPGSVSFEKLSNVGDKRIVGVWVGEEGANTEQDLAYGKGWAPLILENVKADSSIGVDVAMIDACGEVHLGWLKGVICGEVDI